MEVVGGGTSQAHSATFITCEIYKEHMLDHCTAGVMSRCHCIDVHIFGFVQATPLGPVAFERRVILDAGYENSAF